MRVAKGLDLGLGLVLAAMTVGTADAQVTAEQQSAIRANCRSDFMSKCSGVTPGGKEALTCLQKNVEALSAGCKSAVSATLPAPAPAAAAPAPKMEAAAPAAPPPPAPTATVAPAAPVARSVSAPAVAAPSAPQIAKPAVAAKQATPKTAAVTIAGAPARTPAATAPAAAAAAPSITPEQMSAVKFTCRSDFGRYCKGVAPGGP